MIKNRFKNLSLIFLVGAIALSPSFSFGTLSNERIIEIRIEDFLILALGVLWIVNFLVSGRSKLEKPPLFFPILAWLGIGFFSVLTNWIFGNLEISLGFFYLLKEIEFFFIYLYVFYHIKNLDSAKLIIKLWIFLGTVNIGYVIYQIYTVNRGGTYGPSAIGESGSFPTGAFFLLLFIFLFNIFLYYFLNLNISKFKKWILGVLIVGLVVGLIGTASKTNIVAMIFALLLTLPLLFLRKANLKVILIFIPIMIFLVSMFSFIIKNVPDAKRIIPIFSAETLWENYKEARLYDVIEPMLEKSFESSAAYLPVFGLGKGYVGEAHNQYLRNFIEVGITGSLIFFILIFAIIKKL